jgi:hypothetical protein
MTDERAGWTVELDGSISYRNRISARAKAHREAAALGHALGPFTAMGDGLTAFATCRRCGRGMRNDILEHRLVTHPGFFDAPCGRMVAGRSPLA